MNSFCLLRSALCLLTVLTLARPMLAQDDISRQLWLDYDPQFDLTPNINLYGDIGVRTEFEASGWGRFVLRPGLRGPWGDFQWIAGVGGFFTINDTTSNDLEIRPFQGISVWWPKTGLPLNHYVRAEQRFEWTTDNGDFTASLRLRYRLQAQLFWSGIKGGANWRILLHMELFATLTGEAGQFDERTRLGLGFERGVSESFRVRLDVTWQQVGVPLSGTSADEFYVRLRVFHP